MTITTESIRDRLPYVLGGAAAGLALATVVPAGLLLAAGTLAAGGTLACRIWKKKKADSKDEPEIIDIPTPGPIDANEKENN